MGELTKYILQKDVGASVRSPSGIYVNEYLGRDEEVIKATDVDAALAERDASLKALEEHQERHDRIFARQALLIAQKIEEQDGLAEKLFDVIKHGDETHQAWLRDTLKQAIRQAASTPHP